MNVLFISASRYPNNSAEAIRLHYLAGLFSVDHPVEIVYRGTTQDELNRRIKHCGVSREKLLNGNIIARGLDYLLFTSQVKRYLMQSDRKIGAIVVCAMPTATLRFLLRYCKVHQIMLIHDAVEWYSAEEFKFGRFSRLYRKKELWMTKLLCRDVRIIAISHYLEDYFKGIGNRCVYIPSMIDTGKICCTAEEIEERKQNERIKLVYAGSPLKKDYLSVALEGIALLNPDEIARLNIVIIGVTHEQAAANRISDEVLRKLDQSITFMGRIPRDVVFKNLKTANYTMLLRPAEQRYAKAGFPTKVPESMTLGVPVICNYSSDLSCYLKDGVNSVEVENCTPEAMVVSMLRVLSYSKEKMNEMATNTRRTAEEYFDYKVYLEQVRKILE